MSKTRLRSTEGTPPNEAPPRPYRRWYRVGLVATILLNLFVVVTLPVAINSMYQVLGRGSDPLYDFLTARQLTSDEVIMVEAEASYFNLGMVKLDIEAGLATVALSGNQTCATSCPALELTFVALDDDANERRGLPPSVTLNLSPDDRVFSQSVQLPMRGRPSLYPFDTYQLWLGIAGVATLPDGSGIELHPDTLAGRTVTLQNRQETFIMRSPVPVEAQRIESVTDPFSFLTVQELTFVRPAYLQVLTVVLVLLIGVSAAMALVTRTVSDLTLGIGSLILGVWGVRSVLVPQPLPNVSALDLALSWLILVLLLGMSLRAIFYFRHLSDWPLPIPRRRS